MSMSQKTWLANNTASLKGKTVVITGATGGLGTEICRSVLALEGRLVLVNRSADKSRTLRGQLLEEHPGSDIVCLTADLTDMDSVKAVCTQLEQEPVDFLILNAGAYAIPRRTCATGYDNVFQTNFVSHYYMVKRLLPHLAARRAKVLAMGSIAHNYSKTDPADIDFAGRKKASKVYGNSKRYLMFALTELLKNNPDVRFAIAHPGIAFTNITAHYPPLLFAIIKYPMKVIFLQPCQAARSMVKALFTDVPSLHWIGPKLFDIWGNPSVKALTTCDEEERRRIFETAEAIYAKLTASE